MSFKHVSFLLMLLHKSVDAIELAPVRTRIILQVLFKINFLSLVIVKVLVIVGDHLGVLSLDLSFLVLLPFSLFGQEVIFFLVLLRL